MWDCPNGDANMIAESITHCPVCGREREMPRSVAGAVPSHAGAQEGEVGYIAPEVQGEEVEQPSAEVVEEVKHDPEQVDAQAKVDQEQAEDPEPAVVTPANPDGSGQ